jgi:(p)ppGpp synthase/HD superfamily hydrolase
MKFKSDKQRKAVMAKYKKKNTSIPKTITNRNWLFGDFDKDGVPNIDDKYPLDPSKKSRTTEILLSEEIKKIKENNKKYIPIVKRIAKEEGGSYRIKHEYSTINKLRRKHLRDIDDLGGVCIKTKDERSLNEKVAEIRKKYKVIDYDNYYKKPKYGYYYAHHFVIKTPEGKNVEIQLKTNRHSKIHLKSHEAYKRGTKTEEERYKKMAKEALIGDRK